MHEITDARSMPVATPGDASFFGHPRGLGYLAFTEAWERFSFFGMQTLLILYMVDQLLLPGHVENVVGFDAFRAALESVVGPLSSQSLAAMIFGLYSGLAYLLPVFGGLLGDRVVGQHRMVMIGATLMAAGHFLMAFEAPFLVALLLLIVGSGCLKGNIATQVGGLYAAGDRRRTEAFQIFLLGINVGVVLAPLVCGTLGELLGWHWGFGAAGLGMLLGLVIYVSGRRHLPPDRRIVGASEPRVTRLQPGDGRVIVALLVVLVIVTCYLVPGGQIGIIYPLWVRDYVDREAFGGTIPVTWFQSATALASVAMPPLLLRLWQWQARRGREPGNVSKIGWGSFSGVLAYGGLALLAWQAQAFGPVSWAWLVLFHVAYSVAYLYIWPVGLSLFARAAPAAVNSTFIGVYYTAVFFANNLVGWLGRFYEQLSPAQFWGMHVSFVALGTLLVLLLGPWLRRTLASADVAVLRTT